MAKTTTAQQGSVNGYKHGRVPRDVRRTQLLELAEQLFMEKGYGGFSIDDLCRAAGVAANFQPRPPRLVGTCPGASFQLAGSPLVPVPT